MWFYGAKEIGHVKNMFLLLLDYWPDFGFEYGSYSWSMAQVTILRMRWTELLCSLTSRGPTTSLLMDVSFTGDTVSSMPVTEKSWEPVNTWTPRDPTFTKMTIWLLQCGHMGTDFWDLFDFFMFTISLSHNLSLSQKLHIFLWKCRCTF